MLKSLTALIDPRPLGLTRIIVGFAALLRAYVAWRTLSLLTNPQIVKIPYVSWLPEPSMPLVISVVAVWTVAAVLFIIGWRVSLTGPVLLGAIVSTLALDQQAYSNHLYLMAWLVLLLTLASAGSGINVLRRDSPVVRWPVLLIMLQASLVYGFSAITKFNESFLSGSVVASTVGRGLLPFTDSLRTPQVLSVVAAAAVFVELFIAVYLWSRNFRPAAFLLGLGLHMAITLLMTDTLELLVFSLEMLAVYPLFLSRGRLALAFDADCSHCTQSIARFDRFDLQKVLTPITNTDISGQAATAASGIRLVHLGETSRGFRAMTLILEHLVPTLWVAPALRLPGIRFLGDRWYRSRERHHPCTAAGPRAAGSSSVSMA